MAIAFLTVVLAGTLGLGVATTLGFLGARGPDFLSTHFAIALSSVVVAVFGHCFTMFYFIGTGTAIKNAVAERNLDPAFAEEARSLRRKVFPVGGQAILATMVATFAGGATDAGMLRPWIHGTLGILAFALNARALAIEARLLARNNALLGRAVALALGAGKGAPP